MGTIDEHWCNACHLPLDKNKDEYLEFEFVNMPQAKKRRRIGQRLKKPKGNICTDCIKKSGDLEKAIEEMIKAGNPTFKPTLYCRAAFEDSCEDYSPDLSSPAPPACTNQCAHIAVIGDTLYCKRSHPGKLAIPQEVAEVERLNRQAMIEEFQKAFKDPKIAEYANALFFKKKLDDVYIPPSNVVVEEPKNQGEQTQQ